MDRPNHLSVVIDLSPSQWHLCGQSNNAHPLSLAAFLSQLLAFLNSHIACNDENTLSVYGALPGKRYVFPTNDTTLAEPAGNSVLLYSSATAEPGESASPADSNTYRQFKILDSTIMKSLSGQVDALSDIEQEGKTDVRKT